MKPPPTSKPLLPSDISMERCGVIKREMLDYPVSIVVAVTRNGVIGRDGGMPWRLKSDLAWFRSVTLGKPVIMGRKTYDSIGRPLPNRTNIVVSRKTGAKAAGILTVSSIGDALTVAQQSIGDTGTDLRARRFRTVKKYASSVAVRFMAR